MRAGYNAGTAPSDRTGAFRPLLLPQGEGGRRQFDDRLGNKAAKLDLEAGVVLPDGRFVALGSGSTARREHARTRSSMPG
jgi:hypothetical protein